MTKLLLVRHGESQGNLLGVFVGHSNVSLTDKGRLQAALTAQYLDDYPIDVLYSSDLARAAKTARPISERRGLPIHMDKNLREINGGEWEMVSFRDLFKQSPEEYDKWRNHLDLCRCPGGESIAELQRRIKNAIEEITARHRGQSVCIVTHATPLRVMKCVWLGLSLDKITTFGWASNASVTLVEADEDGKYRLVLDGEDRHLAGLQTALPKEI